jgi:hypothetical protein
VTPRRAVALVVALAILRGALGAASTPSAATFSVAQQRISGMGVYTQSKLLAGAIADMGRIAKIGVNTVMFDTWWLIKPGASVMKRQPLVTVDDTLLRQAIRQARAKGMQVALMPKFELGDHRWRGDFVPADPVAFWDSYRRMINHYADLAREEGVWLFFVGSELAALDTQAAEWRRVIAEVRGRYTGYVSYNENQDATRPTRVTWWDAVDIVATTGYFPLTPSQAPSVDELVQAWKRTGLPKLVDMAAKTRKPVMVGEVGYMATEYVGRQPYHDTSNMRYDPELQLRAYQALLQTLYQYPWYAGEFWWSWNGNSYRTPRDKPAEDLLRAWYAFGWRPDGTTTPRFSGLPLPLPLPQIP